MLMDGISLLDLVSLTISAESRAPAVRTGEKQLRQLEYLKRHFYRNQ